MGAILLDHRVGNLLQLADGIDTLLSDRILLRPIALGYLSEGMGWHMRRFEYQEKSQRR